MEWHSEKTFVNSVRFFDEVVRTCDEARHSIRMEYYIFEADEVGNKLIACLQRAVARGIKVQLIVDGFGAASWIRSQARKVSQQVPVRIFHPLPLLLFPGPLLRWVSFLLKINQRNHRKICLVDEKILFLGSQNANIPCASDREPCMWRETGARVEGAAVTELIASHERIWKRSWGFSVRVPIPRILQRTKQRNVFSGLLRINDSPLKRRRLWHDLCHRIRHADQRVWVTNAYFIPQGSLLRSLQHAAQKGADVKVLLPAKSDIPFVPWISAALYYGLLNVGVKIFEYQPMILHAKTLIIDDLGFVGSSNLNYRSMLRDLEVDAILKKPTSVMELKHEFLADLKHAKEITLQAWQHLPWYVRAFGKMALLFKRWM